MLVANLNNHHHYRPCASPSFEVASHVKNCHFSHCYIIMLSRIWTCVEFYSTQNIALNFCCDVFVLMDFSITYISGSEAALHRDAPLVALKHEGPPPAHSQLSPK